MGNIKGLYSEGKKKIGEFFFLNKGIGKIGENRVVCLLCVCS